jgi:hypothetical protein
MNWFAECSSLQLLASLRRLRAMRRAGVGLRPAGMLVLLAGLLMIVMIASPLQAQRISGRVVDSACGRGLPGVRVSLFRDSAAVLTRAADDSGRFDLAAPQPGRYTMQVVVIGYAPYSVSVDGTSDRQLE